MLENQLGGTVVEVSGGIRLRPNSFVDSEEDLEYDLIRGNEDGNFKVELLKLDQRQQQRQEQLLRKQQRDYHQQQLQQQQQRQQTSSNNENHEKVELHRLHDSKSITNQNEYLQRRASNNEKDSIHSNDDKNKENNHVNNQADGNSVSNDADLSRNHDDDEVEEEDREKSPFLFQIVTTHPLDAEAKSMYNLVLNVRHR